MRARGALGSLLVAILCATLTTASVAAPGVRVISATGAQSLKVAAGKGKSTATLVLLVRNDSFHTAKPSAGFISNTLASKVGVETTAAALQAGGIEPVVVRLTAAEAGARFGSVE